MQNDTVVLAGILGRLNSNLLMNKAYSQIILQELAKINNSDYDELLSEVEKLHAEYTFDDQEAIASIIEQSIDPNKPDEWLKKQFGL